MITHFLSLVTSVPAFLHLSSLGVSPETVVLALAHPADTAVSPVPL